MTEVALISLVHELLEETRAGVLATTDQEGHPHMRWMTPVLMEEYPGVLYALTCPSFPKAIQIESQPAVEWLIQSRLLDRVVHLKGTVRLVDNPSLKSQLIERIGGRLQVLWKIHRDCSDLVAVETLLEEANCFKPMEGIYEHVEFLRGRNAE
ncbi:MAG: pyridoxamine 5'-phosphate oxidase family protein [Spirochaetales bacterium]|nr:pyridoxamine 5'-phosphate oxidase family protein [Spirochaetales bacterium]